MVHYEYIMIYLKYFLKGHHLNFYCPFDPNINSHLCHMTYPPTKFDVDCYKVNDHESWRRSSNFEQKWIPGILGRILDLEF